MEEGIIFFFKESSLIIRIKKNSKSLKEWEKKLRKRPRNPIYREILHNTGLNE